MKLLWNCSVKCMNQLLYLLHPIALCFVFLLQKVPQKFTNEYSQRLNEMWLITIRNGYEITMAYDSTNSTLRGISDLVADFGFMGGEVLVFEHVERSVFKVYIIGPDGCEIKYPAIVHASQSTDPITGNFSKLFYFHLCRF